MNVETNINRSNPEQIAEIGNKIYEEKYKTEYEKKYPDKFLAIDISTGDAVIDDYPEKAIKSITDKYPSGIFYLIRIGSSGAIKAGYILSENNNRTF